MIWQFQDVNLVVGGYKPRGITEFEYTINTSSQPIYIAGVGFVKQERAGNPEGTVSYGQYTFFNDPFMAMATGSSPINGSFTYGNRTVVFNSGYIDSYQISAQYGSFPESSISMKYYGTFGSGTAIPVSLAYPEPKIVKPHQIHVNCRGSSTNKVLAMRYGITIPRAPVFQMETNNMTDVYIGGEVRIDTSFTLLVNDYITSGMYNILQSPSGENISITMVDDDENQIAVYSAPNAYLNSERASIGIGKEKVVELSYSSYINV